MKRKNHQNLTWEHNTLYLLDTFNHQKFSFQGQLLKRLQSKPEDEITHGRRHCNKFREDELDLIRSKNIDTLSKNYLQVANTELS